MHVNQSIWALKHPISINLKLPEGLSVQDSYSHQKQEFIWIQQPDYKYSTLPGTLLLTRDFGICETCTGRVVVIQQCVFSFLFSDGNL